MFVCVHSGSLFGLQSDPNPSLVIWLLLVLWQQAGGEKSCNGLTNFRTTAAHLCDTPTQEQKRTCATLTMNNLWFTPAPTSAVTHCWASSYLCCVLLKFLGSRVAPWDLHGLRQQRKSDMSVFQRNGYCSALPQWQKKNVVSDSPPCGYVLKQLYIILYKISHMLRQTMFSISKRKSFIMRHL